MLELAAVAGGPRFREAAIAAIDYERSLFVPEAGNWPDLRIFEERQPPQDGRHQKLMSAWCHGAPGIGMARLAALRHLSDPASLLSTHVEKHKSIRRATSTWRALMQTPRPPMIALAKKAVGEVRNPRSYPAAQSALWGRPPAVGFCRRTFGC